MRLAAWTVRQKLLMLMVPFLRRWHYTRALEQVGPPSRPRVLLAAATLMRARHFCHDQGQAEVLHVWVELHSLG